MIIDIDKIKEISTIGITRAACFMGFAINCVDRDDLKNFDLTKHSFYQFIPQNPSEENITEYKSEFRNWIISNSFRELTNSFEVFLKEIFKLCSLVKKSEVSLKTFDHYGINKKLEYLKTIYGIEPSYAEGFSTINKARNCLSHRQGIVENIDLNEDDFLSIKWIGIELVARKDDEKKVLKYPIQEPFIVNEGFDIMIERSKRQKQIKLNEIINFDVNELSEICFYFNDETITIHNSIINFLKMNNVTINTKV